MKSTASFIPLVLAGAILTVAMVVLCAGRLEYCGQPEAMRPRSVAGAATDSQGPTLAPPQKVVFVQVEADKPDLEIGWLEN
jgi:hypothetical protein